MRLSTTKEEFLENLKQGTVPPIFTEVPYKSPSSLYPRFGGPMSFLLESVKGSARISRYSFIGFDPYTVMKVRDGTTEITTGIKTTKVSEPPLKTLSKLTGQYKQKPDGRLPPFQGGAVGLLSYDFVHYLEKIPSTTINDLLIPDAHFLMIDRLIAFDHQAKKAWTIVCPGARTFDTQSSGTDWSLLYDEAEHELAAIHKAVEEDINNEAISRASVTINTNHDTTKKDYMDMVLRAKDYIAAGDIFQINLSLRVSADIGDITSWEIYSTLKDINPSPFAAFLDFGDYSIASSSPERLVRITDGIVETRPIAGTRPRGRNVNEDRLMREDLLLNEKERAEHIMLIDLERNDIGRVCDYGSVEVDELMITEDYSHVIHIVSNIKGTLASGRTSVDAIRATFPGGTITGVPKVRCMEIIDELEPLSRGPYTGSIGYLGFSGNMDLNIIIRTFTIKNGTAYVHAGAGIVADSDPAREYQESLNKAEALIRTLEKVSSQ
jgi:anthranilate/para-aminobenzoate synthase component I